MPEKEKNIEIEIRIKEGSVEFVDKKTNVVLFVQQLINGQLKKADGGTKLVCGQTPVKNSSVSLQVRKDDESYTLLIYSSTSFQARCKCKLYQASCDDVLQEYFACITEIGDSFELIWG